MVVVDLVYILDRRRVDIGEVDVRLVMSAVAVVFDYPSPRFDLFR